MEKILLDFIKGVFIAFMYYQITTADDMTFNNIVVFAGFYVIILNSAVIAGIDPIIITNAYMTKMVFSIVDQRLTKPKEEITK